MKFDLRNKPPELEKEFEEDISGIVKVLADEDDEALFSATKTAIEAYVRTGIDKPTFEGIYEGIKKGYLDAKDHKPNEELLEKMDDIYKKSIEFKRRIDGNVESYIH